MSGWLNATLNPDDEHGAGFALEIATSNLEAHRLVLILGMTMRIAIRLQVVRGLSLSILLNSMRKRSWLRKTPQGENGFVVVTQVDF